MMMNKHLSPHMPPVDEDDGRTVAPMDLEGTPWQRPTAKLHHNPKAEPLMGKNLFRYMLSAVGAGLLIVLAFSAAGAAFILFCTGVWFK